MLLKFKAAKILLNLNQNVKLWLRYLLITTYEER